MNEEQDISRIFTINESTYRADFEPVYLKYLIKPVQLFQFPILLPFHIPVIDGACYTFPDAITNEARTYKFNTVRTTHNIAAGIITPENEEFPVEYSRIEMINVFKHSKDVNEDSLTDVFDTLLDQLNAVLVAHLILSKDVDIHRVTKEMLQFVSTYRVVNLPDWKNSKVGFFNLHADVPYVRERLGSTDEQELTRYVQLIINELNPFLMTEEMALNSMREFKRGFYRDAVIQCQMSIESFLGTLFIKFREIEGETAETAEEELRKLPFINLVKSEFHPRIGGQWDRTQRETATGKWFNDLYQLRNRIIHIGHQPTFSEANIAIVAGGNFRAYVLSQISEARGRYSEIKKYFHEL